MRLGRLQLAACTALPVTAWIVIATLGLIVPLGFWASIGVRHWQMGGSFADALTAPYFWSVGVARAVGAIMLALLLLSWRRPSSIFLTIGCLWLAGPPIDFLVRGIELLAVSGGRSSWTEGSWRWISISCLFPGVLTCLLLGFPPVRLAYGIGVGSLTTERDIGPVAGGVLRQ